MKACVVHIFIRNKGSKLLGELKKSKSKDLDFFICPLGQHHLTEGQHHLTVRSTSLPQARTNERGCPKGQMELRQAANDVMLRINDAHASRKRKVSSTKVLDFGGLFVFLGVKTPLSPLHISPDLLVSNL